MCGIAGYNCNRDLLQGRSATWAADIAKSGLLLNEMRGTDASGWMATYHVDDRLDPNSDTTLWFNKAPETAHKYVTWDGVLPLGTPTALAVHTRDFTKGSPQDNRNNHPVAHKGILVTHNGSIDNHASIIFDAKLPAIEKDKLGDVDSAAIPVFLSKVTKPSEQLEELDLLIQSLHKMKGKYTFHAMWWNDPGVSLIVAGPDRPMWYMHNENQGLHVYSSEKEAARAIYRKFGVDKKSLREGELKQGSAMLIKEGVILRKWEFELPTAYSYGAVTYGTPTMERVSDFKIDLSNKAQNHWTRENAPITLDEAKDFEGSRLFCLKHNDPTVMEKYNGPVLNKIQDSFMKRSLTPSWIGLEADEVWVSLPEIEVLADNIVWTNWKIRFFTVYQSLVEIVWDKSLQLLDVYNWTVKAKDYPWRPLALPTAKTLTKAIELSDKTWFNRVLDKSAPLAQESVNKRQAKLKTVQTLPILGSGTKKSTFSMFDDDYDEYFVPHTEVDGMVFLQNKWCFIHKVTYDEHPKPLECPYAVESAWDMLGLIQDLNDANEMYETAQLHVRGKSVCHETDESHSWVETARAKETVVLKYESKDDITFEVSYPVAESCSRPHCSLRRNWANPPHFGMTKEAK